MKIRTRLKYTLFLSLSLVMTFGPSISMHASADSICPTGMSDLDCNALFNNWINWVPDNGDCSTTLDSVALLGGDNPTKTYNYFVQKGLPPAAAAGIIGNLEVESGIDPTRLQGVFDKEVSSATLSQTQLDNPSLGWGIAQWTPSSKIVTTSQVKGVAFATIDSLSFQLDFLWKEITNSEFSKLLTDLKAQTGTAPTDAAAAASNFDSEFERAAGGGDLGLRQKDAQDALAKYSKNGTTSDGVSAPTPTDGSCGATDSTNSSFVFYNQCDDKWSNHPYDGGTLCENGCGPTSMAMIITNLTGTALLPTTLADWYQAQGYATTGTTWGAAPAAAKKYGLKATAISNDVAKISAVVKSGGMVIMAGTGSLPFTSHGHFIAIRAVTDSGKWMVADPYDTGSHVGDDTKQWDPQAVLAAGAESGSAYAITK